MARPPSDLFCAIGALLADGEWHDRQEIVRLVSPMIPHETAWRQYAADYRRQRARRGSVRFTARSSPHHRFQVGARQIINELLQRMVETGWLTRSDGAFRSYRFMLLHEVDR